MKGFNLIFSNFRVWIHQWDHPNLNFACRILVKVAWPSKVREQQSQVGRKDLRL